MRRERTWGIVTRRSIVALAAVPWLATAARGQGCASGFAGARSYPVQGAFALADVDRDGDLDLAVAGAGSISLLVNAGDATFGPATTLPLPFDAGDITSADLDGNGTSDLVVTASQRNEIDTLAGNGDGTFQPPVPVPLPVPARRIASGDLDGDGVVDLVTANDDGSVGVCFGTGAGTFGPAATYAAGTALLALVLHDMNGDGATDIATLEDAAVIVLVNGGAGGFLGPQRYPAPTGTTSLAVGLLNGDVAPDIVLGGSQGLHIMLGSGGGALGPAQLLDWPHAGAVAIVDIDGDGDEDIVASQYGYLTLFAGDGAGAFANVASYASPWWGTKLRCGHLDADGFVDVVVDSIYLLSLTVYRGVAGGRLQGAPYDDLGAQPQWPFPAEKGDFNGDGFPDLAVARPYYSTGLTILQNDGTGRFFERARYSSIRGNRVVSGDWNLDGRPDLVVADDDAYTYQRVLLLGNGDGTFRSGPSLRDHGGGRLVAVDVDGDGAVDLVTGPGQYQPWPNVGVDLSNGDGTFQSPIDTPLSTWPNDWLASDVDGDGLADFVALSTAGRISVMDGNGDGTFQPAVEYPIGTSAYHVAAADFNADGAVDLAAVSDRVTVLLGTGTGGFLAGPTTSIPWTAHATTSSSRDLDGDGVLDFVVSAPGAVVPLHGLGNGAFQYRDAYVGWGVRVFADDFDGDDATDILFDSRRLLLRHLGVTVLPEALPAGSVNVPYAETIRATGGSAPYAFSVASGALPPGLTLAPSGLLAGTPSAAGAYGFSVLATDAAGCGSTRSYRLRIGSGAGASLVAGAGLGLPNPNRVKVYRQDGAATDTDFFAYGAGKWGVNVASGPVDGSDDRILTGPGPGAVYGPQVRGFRRRGVPMPGLNFYAYGTLRYGVNPAAGDVDGGARDDVITGPGPGVVFGPHVRGFRDDGAGVSSISGLTYYAYATPRYGVNVTAGDVDGDGFHEIVTAPGPGPWFGAQVRGWDFDATAVAAIGRINFYALPVQGYGANAAAGDVDGDPFAELAATPGPGAGPLYAPRFVGFDYDGASVAALPGLDVTTSGATSHGGRVGLADVTGDGNGDLLTGLGRDPAALSTVSPHVYAGGVLTPLYSFEAFAGSAYGVNLAGGSLGP